MSKNNSINFWRFIFTMSVVVFHFTLRYKQFNIDLGCNNGWRLAVEFFFIVSGFLLAYKCENSDLTAWEYTKHRFKRLFPPYFLMMIVAAVFWIIECKMDYKEVFVYILNLTDELLMVQSTALNFVANNNPAWYISSLIICGYFIFYLLRKYKETFSHFIAPLICLVVYSYMHMEFGSLRGNVETFSSVLGISTAIIRCFGGMCAGIISYELCKQIKTIKLTKFGTGLARFIEFFGYTSMLVYTFVLGSTGLDFIFVIFFVICTALAFSREKKSALLNNQVTEYLAKISYGIYLTHDIVVKILYKHIILPENYSIKVFWLYLLIAIVFGALCDVISSRAEAFLVKKSNECGGFIIKKQKSSKRG